MVTATKGILINCEPAVKEILLLLDSTMNFIIEDLDASHLFIDPSQLESVQQALQQRILALSHLPMKKLSNSMLASLQDPSAPTLTSTQHVARLQSSLGKSSFTASLPCGTLLHCTLTSKLKNSLWMHRGTFVLVEESGEGKGEIVGVLSREQIKEMKREGTWPVEFVQEETPRIIRGAVVSEDSDGASDRSDSDNE